MPSCLACEEPIADDATSGDFCPRCAVLSVHDRRELRARNDARARRHHDEAHARLVAIVESSDDAIVSKDLNGIITSWNHGAVRIFGYEPDEVVGRPITIIMPPDRFDEEPGILARIRRGERVDHYETVRVRKDGTPIEISLTVSPIRDATGVVVGASKVARDITERRQAERLEQRRAEQVETLLNRAPIGVYLVDADFRVQHVNPVALPVFGELSEGLIGRDFEEVIHRIWDDAYADEIVQQFRHTLATGEPYVSPERVRERRDRVAIEAYTWEIHRIATPDGRFGVVCYFRDVSADVRARDVVAASEERYRTLVSVISDVEWTSDPSGRFVVMQDEWVQLTGQTWERSRGYGWLDAFHPDDRARIETSWRDACRTGRPYEEQGRVWSARHAEHRAMVTRATPIRGVDGAIREWVGICTDVTEQRRSEEVLRQANRQKDEFLAMLGHELRNPLAAVRNAVAVASLDPARQARALEIARRQTDQLGRLIDDLLDVARITRGRIPLRIETVALRDVLQRALDHTTSFIESRGLRLELAITASVRLDADPARLEQVFVNLLGNAAKYTEPGGWIRLEAGVEDGEAVVTIRDSGMGIAPDVLPHVWDLFAQGSRTLDRSQGGLGIGLTVAKQLVELHGGRIGAESGGVGQGSAFTVRLPASATATSAAVAVTTNGAKAVAAPPAEVLVVEDDPDAADSLVMLLELLGQNVRVTYDGVAALDAARAAVPDLMLVDIGLPGLDGYEVARRVRRDPTLRHCVLVALTGYGRDEDKRQALAAGFDDHVVKPVEIDMLRDVVERARDESRSPLDVR